MDEDTERELRQWTVSLAQPDNAKSFVQLKKFLEFLKEKKVHDPLLVTRHGAVFLQLHAGKLGSEVWNMYERVCLAAIESHDLSVAEDCCAKLRKQFKESTRVSLLEGMVLEAKGECKQAEAIYEKILKKDPAHQTVAKRRIALFKERGDIPGAIEALTKYLTLFCSDENAWLELSEIYVSVGKLELAKFALEELLLIVPENYLFHLKYAEVVYTLGGKSNVALARQYYAQSLELKPNNNLRAQYGLMMCLHAKGSNKLAEELHKFSGEKILESYKNVTNSEAVASFQKQNLSFSFGAPTPKPSATPALTLNPNPFLLNVVHAAVTL